MLSYIHIKNTQEFVKMQGISSVKQFINSICCHLHVNLCLWPTINGIYNLSYFLENENECLIYVLSISHSAMECWPADTSLVFLTITFLRVIQWAFWFKPVERLANASIHQDLIILRWTDDLSFWIAKLRSKPQNRGTNRCNKEACPSQWDFPTHHILLHLRVMSAAKRQQR